MLSSSKSFRGLGNVLNKTARDAKRKLITIKYEKKVIGDE